MASTAPLVFVPRANASQEAFDFGAPARLHADTGVAITPEVEALLALDAVVAVGVSGGKDSQATAIATARHLDAIGHRGPRLLIHADLGVVEWRASRRICEELAAHLGWELVVQTRKAGDMLARWRGRWASNVERYEQLACVRLILPWSTPKMRFCTSELKEAVIASYLRRRFPGRPIVSVTGIRREESTNRARQPVAKTDARLTPRGAPAMKWHPIIEHRLDAVLASIAGEGLALHEAYTVWGSTRVSCVACIMSSEHDLRAATSCPDNADVYRAMVALEARSTFAFQGARWLADVAPHLLPETLAERIERAKAAAAQRAALEAQIPPHLNFKDGVPQAVPTFAEAAHLAQIRREVGSLVGLRPAHTDAQSVQARFAALAALAAAKTGSAPCRQGEEEEAADLMCE